MRYSNVPGWLVFGGMTVVASIILGGLVALLLVGRTVPAELWTLGGAVGVAYFGSGPFSQVLNGHQVAEANHAAHATELVDTVNHALATVRDTAGAASTTSTTSTIPSPS